MATKYPVVTFTGKRQCGKSTLLKSAFPDYRYVSLEDLDLRMMAKDNPRGFLQNFGGKTIIDEVQYVPALFSYIQTKVGAENETGISAPTANAWLSLLKSSYVIFLLKPYHNNFNKRLVKSPKLYFYDTGLASSLLGLENSAQLSTQYLRGEIFENMVIPKIVKQHFFAGKEPQIYF
ncbi:MAG: ATP-binding protein [Dysgonamonadaceae bacterium]|nr:ATP-binding protein [Dysgonamonadaceae bacterium]